jgi:hypothetical protein
MAAKWYNANFSGTTEDARNYCHPEGGGLYSNDIIKYLSHVNVTYHAINLNSIDQLKNEIDLNHIAIIKLDMGLLKFNNTPEQHCDLFYNADFGFFHFIVIKGYKEVDGQLFFEAYDPYSLSQRYSDGSLKGKDRYYRSWDIDNSVRSVGESTIIISKN